MLHIKIPLNIQCNLTLNTLIIQGPLGSLKRQIPEIVGITKEKDTLTLNLEEKWISYTTRTQILNMITGVTDGYNKILKIEGIGYSAVKIGNTIRFQLGSTHFKDYPIPCSKIVLTKFILITPNILVIEGISKNAVGRYASTIKDIIKPNAYHLRGIYYNGLAKLVELKKSIKK